MLERYGTLLEGLASFQQLDGAVWHLYSTRLPIQPLNAPMA